MAKQKGAANLEPAYQNAIENFIKSEVDNNFVPDEPIEEPVEPQEPIETPLEPDEPIEVKKPVEKPVVEPKPAKEPEVDPNEEVPDFDLELEPEIVQTEWDTIASEAGIDAKGKDAVIAEIKKLKSEREELNKEVEQVRNLNAVKNQIQVLDTLLALDPENLIRRNLEIEGYTPSDIEDEIADLIENNTLNATYRATKLKINGIKNQVIANAPKIREASETALTTASADFQAKASEHVKTLSTILGLKFKPDDLTTLHGRAERLLQSKDFQDKLKDPKFVAELALQVAAGKSVEKGLENKFKNIARNQVVNDFGNPTNRTTKRVERPAHLEKQLEQPEKIKGLLEDISKGNFSVGA